MSRHDHFNISIRLLVCPVLILLTTKASWAQQPSTATSESQAIEEQVLSSSRVVPDARYRIGPGDVLEIRVFERPQLSRDSLRVDGNGVIHMPLIQGDLVAACQTEFGLAQGIAERYRVYLKNPEVEVFVKEFSSQPVEVIGAITKPGNFQLQRRVRLRELIALAGGPSPDAGKFVRVIQDENTPSCGTKPAAVTATNVKFATGPGPRGNAGLAEEEQTPATDPNVTSYSLEALMSGDGAANPYVRPGDFVHIPKADQVYVVGNVYKPTAISLSEKLTVSRAIAVAGGVLPSTKRSKIRIVRSHGDGNSELFVDLEQINRNQQPDLLLEPNDIVEVPTSIGKLALRAFFTSIVPAYAVYGPLTQIH